MPSIFKRPVAAHSVVLVGYEEQKKHFIVRNSWGEQWGDKGYGYLRYAYFSRYQLEAWILGPVHASRARSGTDGIYEQQWGTSDHFAKSPLHGFEIFDGAADECIGWAFVVEREGMAEIEELFVRPGYRRKGYGRRLAQMIKLSQRLAERPLKIWGSHADKEAAHSPAANQLFRLLNLSVRSPVREKWASFVAE
jgi:GNAT superfamily N-acetyltransferase